MIKNAQAPHDAIETVERTEAANARFVLLVEDDPAHAELIRRAFEARSPDTKLEIATCLTEARAYLGANPTSPPTLVIADWRLPDGQGVELLDIPSDARLYPVVIMTSYGNERIAVEAMKAGAIDYVVKSGPALADMPHVAERAIRDWNIRTERARIARALRASEERLRTVVTNVPVVLFSTDRDGIFTLAEGRGLDLVHLKPGEVVGQSAFDAWQDAPNAVAGLRSALSGHGVRTVVEIGDVMLETSVSPLKDAQGNVTGVIGVAIDVTEREQAEKRLRLASLELGEAYDATLAGWSRALELREHETAGHSQRVVDLTLRIARAVGVAGSDLIHIRRGALLHDIGKMAVPDHILLKPDPLASDEWVIMRQHPQYAYEMLKSISYLRPALDIPYCHHEHWDGKGYPRGLAREQIPLAARIFAVADVWDALTSNRAYRPAWPEKEAQAHMRAQAGKQLDPRIVEAFLDLVYPEEINARMSGAAFR